MEKSPAPRVCLPLLLVALASVADAGDGAAPPPPWSRPAIEARIAELSHDDIRIREAAFSAILEAGVERPEETLALLPNEGDFETLRACDTLRHRIPRERHVRKTLSETDGDKAFSLAVRRLYHRPARDTITNLMTLASGHPERVRTAAEILIHLLTDSAPEVRREAIGRLADCDAPDALAAVAALAPSDPAPAVRAAALSYICQKGTAAHVGQAVSHLADPDAGVRMEALKVTCRLGQSGMPAEVEEKVAACLADPEAAIRYLALQILSGTGNAERVPDVAPLLKDPDRAVREMAVMALEKAGGKPCARFIADFMDADVDDGIEVTNGATRIVAAQAVLRLGDRSFYPRVARRMLSDPVPFARASIAEGFGLYGSRADIPALARALDDPDGQVRFMAAGAIARLTGETWNARVDDAKVWWETHRENPDFTETRPENPETREEK